MVPESQIQAEIHSEEDRIFGEVYDQLKAQNALKYLSTFEEILRPQIEMSVRAEYNIATNSITTNSLNLYYWPNGGVTTCISSPGNLSVATTLMNYDDTYNYILSTGGSFTLRDVIQAILGFIPKFGNVFSGIFSMTTTVNKAALKSVREAGGYGYVMNIHDPSTLDDTSVLVGWDNYPYFYADSSATDFHATQF